MGWHFLKRLGLHFIVLSSKCEHQGKPFEPLNVVVLIN